MLNQERTLAAIVYTDIVGFSELSASDERRALELVNTQRDIINPLIKNYNGILHKEIGDGFLLTFPTVTSAVEFSINFQKAIKKIDGLKIRIGIHAGEITIQNGDVFGDDVNVGARIEPFSPIGGIAISEKVKLEIGSLSEYETEFITEPELKGIRQPVKIYCISSHGMLDSKTKASFSKYKHKKSSFKINVLNATGFLFTIIGAVFWLWYGFGGVSHAIDMDKKIFKSLAVLYLDNLSNDPDDDNLCAGLTNSITTAFSRLGAFDVTSRTNVLKFRNKVTSHTEIHDVLDVDAYFEGSLIKSSNNEYTANIALIDAEKGHSLWAKEFINTAENILKIPKNIVKEASKALNENSNIQSTLIEEVSASDNTSTSKMMGIGINLLDTEQYEKSIAIFNSILKKDPANNRAIYSKGQAYQGLKQYSNAIETYRSLLDMEIKKPRLINIWRHPDNFDLNYKLKNTLFVQNLNIKILINKNKKINQTDIFALDLNTNKILWNKTYNTTAINESLFEDYLILTTTSLGEKEATLYIHDLKQDGAIIYSREFSKSFNNETIIISVLDNLSDSGEYDSSAQNKDIIYFNIHKNDSYELLLFDTITKSPLWIKQYSLNDKTDGSTKIFSFINNETQYLIHEKGSNLYLYNEKTGEEVWHKLLDLNQNKIGFIKNRIIYYSTTNNEIKINNPINDKTIASITLDSPLNKYGAILDDIIIQTKNSIYSVKTNKNIFQNIKNWSYSIQEEASITKIFFLGDNIFLLTNNGELLCINALKGKLIKNNQLDVYEHVHFFADKINNNAVLYSDGFLIGIDPHNGSLLWKIREPLIGVQNRNNNSNFSNISFINNQLIITKMNAKNDYGGISINAYNPVSGELLWKSNERICENCDNSNSSLAFQSYKQKIYINATFKNNSSYDDKAYSVDLSWEPNKDFIPKDELFNQLAFCYLNTGQKEKAKSILNKIIQSIDQQNEVAYNELLNIYNHNNKENYTSIISEYYDLIKYDEKKRSQIEGKLMKNNDLQWIYNFKKYQDFSINMAKNKLVIIGQCEANNGCSLSAFRNQSGIKLWNKKINGLSDYIYSEDSNGKALIIGQEFSKEFLEQSKNNIKIIMIDPINGNLLSEYILPIPSKSNFQFNKFASLSNIYLLDAIINNSRYLYAIDAKTGHTKWSRTFNDETFINKNVNFVKYNDGIILPIQETLEYLNLSNGESFWSFDFTDDLDGIEYLNSEGLINNSISFISDADEYIVFDIEKQQIVLQEDVETDEVLIYNFVDNSNIIAYNNYGHLVRYELKDEVVDLIWEKKINNIYNINIKNEKDNIFIQDKLYILKIDFINGNTLNKYPFIWWPKNIFVDNKYLGCFNARKLYFLNI